MAEPAAQQARGNSRREFLNYVWGASMALFMAQFGGAIFLFALPRFREGEFGGRKTIGAVAEKLPQPDSPPVAFPDVKVWLANVGPNNAASSGGQQGLVALYRVCVHLGCLYAWSIRPAALNARATVPSTNWTARTSKARPRATSIALW